MYEPLTICTVTRREPGDNPVNADHMLWDDYIVTLPSVEPDRSDEVIVLPWGSDRYMALAAVIDNEPFTFDPEDES